MFTKSKINTNLKIVSVCVVWNKEPLINILEIRNDSILVSEWFDLIWKTSLASDSIQLCCELIFFQFFVGLLDNKFSCLRCWIGRYKQLIYNMLFDLMKWEINQHKTAIKRACVCVWVRTISIGFVCSCVDNVWKTDRLVAHTHTLFIIDSHNYQIFDWLMNWFVKSSRFFSRYEKRSNSFSTTLSQLFSLQKHNIPVLLKRRYSNVKTAANITVLGIETSCDDTGLRFLLLCVFSFVALLTVFCCWSSTRKYSGCCGNFGTLYCWRSYCSSTSYSLFFPCIYSYNTHLFCFCYLIR